MQKNNFVSPKTKNDTKQQKQQISAIKKSHSDLKQIKNLLKGQILYMYFQDQFGKTKRMLQHQAVIKQMGGQIFKRLTPKVTIIVTNVHKGSFYKKAKQYNIKVVDIYWVNHCYNLKSKAPFNQTYVMKQKIVTVAQPEQKSLFIKFSYEILQKNAKDYLSKKIKDDKQAEQIFKLGKAKIKQMINLGFQQFKPRVYDIPKYQSRKPQNNKRRSKNKNKKKQIQDFSEKQQQQQQDQLLNQYRNQLAQVSQYSIKKKQPSDFQLRVMKKMQERQQKLKKQQQKNRKQQIPQIDQNSNNLQNVNSNNFQKPTNFDKFVHTQSKSKLSQNSFHHRNNDNSQSKYSKSEKNRMGFLHSFHTSQGKFSKKKITQYMDDEQDQSNSAFNLIRFNYTSANKSPINEQKIKIKQQKKIDQNNQSDSQSVVNSQNNFSNKSDKSYKLNNEPQKSNLTNKYQTYAKKRLSNVKQEQDINASQGTVSMGEISMRCQQDQKQFNHQSSFCLFNFQRPSSNLEIQKNIKKIKIHCNSYPLFEKIQKVNKTKHQKGDNTLIIVSFLPKQDHLYLYDSQSLFDKILAALGPSKAIINQKFLDYFNIFNTMESRQQFLNSQQFYGKFKIIIKLNRKIVKNKKIYIMDSLQKPNLERIVNKMQGILLQKDSKTLSGQADIIIRSKIDKFDNKQKVMNQQDFLNKILAQT